MRNLDKIIDAFREVVVLMFNNMLPQLMLIELNLDITNCTYFSIIKNNFPLPLSFKCQVYFFVATFKWQLLPCGRRYFLFQNLKYRGWHVSLTKRNEELIHKSNKVLHKFDMNYSFFLYHILSRTHAKKKH